MLETIMLSWLHGETLHFSELCPLYFSLILVWAYSLWGCKEPNTTEQLTQHLNIKDFPESVSPADEKKNQSKKEIEFFFYFTEV